jgi:hypothetical protein
LKSEVLLGADRHNEPWSAEGQIVLKTSAVEPAPPAATFDLGRSSLLRREKAAPFAAARSGEPSALSASAWVIIHAALYITYSLCYLGTEPSPGNPSLPLGWLAWFDQSNYLSQSASFAKHTWRTTYQYYPPLYPWLGSWFIEFWPAHPFYLIDFAGLAAHAASIVVIGRRCFGMGVASLSIVGAFVLFPFITLDQWAVPWTTSVSAGLGAMLLLIFARFALRDWAVATTADWIWIAVYSLGYGAIFAVRPLDVVVWLPASLIFYAHLFLRSLHPLRLSFPLKRAATLTLVVAAGGLLLPILYAYFNYANTGTIEGTYVAVQRGSGYQFYGFLRKFISLFLDSGTVYVESDASIADRFWPVYLAFPLILYYSFAARGPLRAAVLTIAAQFAIYTPFGDLLPNGLYRFFNVHYFAWTFPWLLLLCLGFLGSFLRLTRATSRPSLAAVVAVGVASLLCWLVTLRAYPVGEAKVAALSSHEVEITLDASRGVDFIDVLGATATWPELYLDLGANQLEVDGKPLRIVAEYRLWPINDGLRITFPRTNVGQHFLLRFNPKGHIDPKLLAARAALASPSVSCRFVDCTMPSLLPAADPITKPTTLVLGATGNAAAYLADGWSFAEDWGRWTSKVSGHVIFNVGAHGPLSIRAYIRPLLSAKRRSQTVSITANGCPVADVSFSIPIDAVQLIEGAMPQTCVSSDGKVDLAFTSDRAVKPRAIGLGDDGRSLGIGVQSIDIVVRR